MRPFRPISTTPKKRSLRTFGSARDGGVAVTVAVMTVVLVGVLAVAIDLGRAYNLSTELDNAADAYALAGATQLDQSPGSCNRAIQAAVAAGTSQDLVNTETFASNSSGSDVYVDPTLNHITNTNIRFLRDLDKDSNGNLINYVTDPDSAVCDDTAEYIEVTIDQASQGDQYRVDYAFAGIVNAATQTFPKGYAVAGTSRLFCGVAPIMICELEPSFWANLKADPTYYRGVGVWVKATSPSDTWGPGNAGFLDLGGRGGGVGPPNGTGLCNAIGAVNPEQACLGTDNLTTEPGNKSGARECFNTRLDIFHGSVGGLTNDPQWQPAANTVKGRFKEGCNDPGWAVPGTNYTGPGSIPLPPPADAGMPLPPDNCSYVAGGGGCIPTGAEGRMGDGVWDFEAYLEINHPGLAYADAMSQIIETGPTGPGLGRFDNVTRYDVYRWELGYPDMLTYGPGDYGNIDEPNQNLVNNVPVPETPLPQPLGAGPTPPNPQEGEYGGPQCYTGAMGDVGTTTIVTKDRRIVRVAVVDCTSGKNPPIKGRTEGVEAEGFLDLFLLLPWKDAGSNHELYFEIIQPANDQNYDKTAAKEIVQLYE